EVAVYPLSQGQLLSKTFTKVGVVGVLGTDHLDRRRPSVWVQAEVDPAHPARAEKRNGAVRAHLAGVVGSKWLHGVLPVSSVRRRWRNRCRGRPGRYRPPRRSRAFRRRG